MLKPVRLYWWHLLLLPQFGLKLKVTFTLLLQLPEEILHWSCPHWHITFAGLRTLLHGLDTRGVGKIIIFILFPSWGMELYPYNTIGGKLPDIDKGLRFRKGKRNYKYQTHIILGQVERDWGVSLKYSVLNFCFWFPFSPQSIRPHNYILIKIHRDF